MAPVNPFSTFEPIYSSPIRKALREANLLRETRQRVFARAALVIWLRKEVWDGPRGRGRSTLDDLATFNEEELRALMFDCLDHALNNRK
jgi:hypothetical protein